MIITDLQAYRQDCGTLLRYIADPVKTKIVKEESKGYSFRLEDLYGNICSGKERNTYVTGINVDPDTAEEEFNRTLSVFLPKEGINALHAVQSFEPGEISAKEAHAFGITLACAFCGSNYEAVVATHTDHAHFHNHIVINAVSWSNGEELLNGTDNLRKLRRLAHKLAPSFGIYREKALSAEKDFEAQRALREVNEAVALSRSFKEFRIRMKERGYAYSSLEEPVLVLQNGEALALGEEYSEELLRERIYEKKSEKEEPSFLEADAGRLRGMQILYFRFLCRLTLPEERIPKDFLKMRSEKDLYEEEAYFLYRNGISTLTDLEKEKTELVSKLARCRAEKDSLSQAICRCGKEEKKAYLTEIRDLLRQDCEVLQNEIALCERIAEHTEVLEEKFRLYDKRSEKKQMPER